MKKMHSDASLCRDIRMEKLALPYAFKNETLILPKNTVYTLNYGLNFKVQKT